MGLAIQVGVFAKAAEDPEWADDLRASFQRLSKVLVREGMVPHEEPEEIEFIRTRALFDSFPYSYLHYLRRIFAHVATDSQFIAEPLADGDDPCEDSVLRQGYERGESHLLCHSDCEGF